MATGWFATGLLTQGSTSEDVAGSGTTTLAVSDAQFGTIVLTGILTGNRVIKVPSGLTITGARWNVYNNTTGAYTLTFGGATGNAVTIAQGKRVDVIFDGTNMVPVNTDAGASGLPGVLYANTADSSAIASTAVETNFSLNYTLPQNFLSVGRVLRVTASGKYSDTGTPTLTLKLKAGSVTLMDIGAVTLGSGVSNKQWTATFLLVCRTTGGSGTVQANLLQSRLDDDMRQAIANVATVDTTATNVLQVSATWSASDAANTTTQELLLIEALN
jgi:hypothetical protein